MANRNNYDTDVTVFSPRGRLFQVEYATSAVSQGSACVGLRSDTHVVVAALKRQPSELATHQPKIFRIDDHLGITIAGLTADARVLAKYMQTECLNHKYVFESPMVIGRLVEQVADKHQSCTQSYVRRPYGVGLLIAGYDRTGPHLYETSPSGTYLEYKAHAIGARSQSAKTYLSRLFDKYEEDNGKGTAFGTMGADELIRHGIRALRGCVPGDVELSTKNVSIGVVGRDREFQVIENDDLEPAFTAALADEETKEEDGDAPMELTTVDNA